MQIPAIVGNLYTKSSVSAKNQQTEEIYSAFTSSFEKELFANILEWKSFCHKQIIKNNLDYIA